MLGYSSIDDEVKDITESAYTINPKAGYLIADDLALGLEMSYDFSKTEDDILGNKENKEISAGVFVRYYFLNLGERFKTYAELGGGYLSSESGFVSAPTKATGFQGGFNLGLNYFVKENIAISFVVSDIANYQSLKYDEVRNDDGDVITESQTVDTINADVNVLNNFFQSAKFGVMFKF